MKTTKRFDNAVTKLYTAFHNGTLNALKCEACAVGNLCDNDGGWFNIGEEFNHRKIPFRYTLKTGYSVEELNTIESLFMFGTKNIHTDVSKFYSSDNKKETQFKGLCAVVEYLCELDNIPNVMDYTKLFETENNQPKYALI